MIIILTIQENDNYQYPVEKPKIAKCDKSGIMQYLDIYANKGSVVLVALTYVETLAHVVLWYEALPRSMRQQLGRASVEPG